MTEPRWLTSHEIIVRKKHDGVAKAVMAFHKLLRFMIVAGVAADTGDLCRDARIVLASQRDIFFYKISFHCAVECSAQTCAGTFREYRGNASLAPILFAPEIMRNLVASGEELRLPFFARKNLQDLGK